MKSKAFFLMSLAILAYNAVAQNLDTLVFTDQRIIAQVKEVTPETVGYLLPGRDILYKKDKIHLIKICYADGKTEESRLTNKEIIEPENWSQVTIATRQEDVHGLYKIGEIVIPGIAASDRGKAWLKVEAAMMGGNVVMPTGSNQFTSTRYVSSPISSRSRNPTYFSYPYTSIYYQTAASVYSSKPMNYEAFKEIMTEGPYLSIAGHLKQRGTKKRRVVSADFLPAECQIEQCTVEENNIFVRINLHGFENIKFHVNYFDKSRMLLSFKKRWYSQSQVLIFFLKEYSQPPTAKG